MNVSYNWLVELSGTLLAPRELAQALTMIGLAVESVHAAGEDYVLDIDLTSNRPDCLSHLGVAREIAVIENGRAQVPETKLSNVSGRAEDLTSVEIRDADLCPRYAAQIVRDVKIAPSPDWLVKRLEAIGQRSINNVADITNYVLHEQGQPLHAFDFWKLSERRIVVRRAETGEKIKTLDGTERKLDAAMLVIADARRAVAIAGVMGGEETEISDSTRDVLIESAYFNPASVRRTSKLLGLHTEASHRFERGADYGNALRALARCVELICEIAGGAATENAIDVYPKLIMQKSVSLRAARVEALTGLCVEVETMQKILAALGFEQVNEGSADERTLQPKEAAPTHLPSSAESEMTFTAPTWRVDVEREEDLVEEVARHVGYEKIATALPASNIAGEYRPSEGKRRAMRRAMTACGFDEAISLSFIDSADDDRFELLPGLAESVDGANPFVTLSNPIIEGAARMRPTLLPGLLEALRHNFNHGTRDVRLFETGRVFASNAVRAELPDEREAFAMLATGGATEEARAGATRDVDFYDLKGALEAVAAAMNVESLRFEATLKARHLRAGQAAQILIDGRKAIGTLGRLDESVAALYKFRQPVYVAELDFGALLEAQESPVLYSPLGRYPSVVRDVSLLIERRVTLAEMLDLISAQKIDDWRSAKLVDVYEGKGVPETKRSVTLRIEYRADERTLRDEEVDQMHARIVSVLEESFGAELRQ